MRRPFVTTLPPEDESAGHGAPSGTCSGSGMGMPPPEPSYSLPLAEDGPGMCCNFGHRRGRTWRVVLGVALVWAGDILGALSLFVMLYVLLIGAAVFQ